MWEHETDQKLKKSKLTQKKKTDTLFHENIRALGWL